MEVGLVRQVELVEEMRSAYLDYAMSVIVARALPDVRDGLKPVQRRILYAMYELGLRPNSAYKKSARIVGEVLGKYHPHGDSPVYEAMVRMAQPFSLRYPLVDGQGNFGSIDGDGAAAMRYTEARLAPIALELLADIDKDTVDFVPNFDNSLKEPTVLPARLPNLLVNGAAGIAVGMATNIPPHNLREVCDAIQLLIRKPDATVEELMKVLPGPDFPTGGIILGVEGIKSAYATGRGRIVVRGKVHIEEARGGRQQIVITELPFQVNKSRLIERIATLVKDGRLQEISDLRDESDRTGIRVVVLLKRDANAKKVLNRLFKYTQLQITFGANMIALVDGVQPRVLPLKRMLKAFIEHRQEVITRRSRYELEKARNRAHILEGLKVALDHLDEVIETIRRSRTVDTARTNLMRRFKLSQAQAQAILEMQLRRLAALERKKVEEEYREVIRRIAYLEDLLANPRKILLLISQEMDELKEKYGDPRRTRIEPEASGDFDLEDLIPDQLVAVTLSERGYIKRVPHQVYRPQRRGGRGIRGMVTREEDAVRHLLLCNTLDDLLLFTDRGRVFKIPVHQVPDADRTARGLPASNLVSLERRERITALLAVPKGAEGRYLVMATRRGRVKRTVAREFESVRSNGLIAISLEKGDELAWVRLAQGGEEILLVTAGGMAIRFPQDQVRPMGRSAAGVWGIRLAKGDEVVAMDLVVDPSRDLLLVTERGRGKRTALKEFPTQGRHGKGVIAVKLQKGDRVAAARIVGPEDEAMLISAEGIVLRVPVEEISRQGRPTRGVAVMDLKEGDHVAALAILQAEEEEG